jgi:hypothetical protein
MRPAVVAFRLLQPRLRTTYEHRPRAPTLASRRGPQSPSRSGSRGDSSLARDEADVPRATNPAVAPPTPLSPVKAWRLRSCLLHPPRRRLATPPTGGPGFVGRETERRTRAPWWGARRSPPQLLPCTHRHRLARRRVWRHPHVRNGTGRDPRSVAPPRRGAPSGGPGCIPPPAARPVREDHSTRPCRVGLPSRRPYGRGIAKRCVHRSRWGRRASALHALAGESERLCYQPQPPRPTERSGHGSSVGQTAMRFPSRGVESTAAPLTVSTV